MNSNDTLPSQAKAALYILNRAVAAVRNGIIIADAQQPDYPIIYCNPAFEEITGYSQAEILGRNCRFLQGPATDPTVTVQIRDALQNGRECRVVLKNYRKDGTPFWNELTISPVRDDAGRLTHFVGIQNDITARKEAEEAQQETVQRLQEAYQQAIVYAQELKGEILERRRAEAALRENEGRLHSVVENALDGIITIDEQGLIDSFNPAAERIFGYSAAEVIGQNVKLLMPEPYHSQHDSYLANYRQTGQPKIIGVGREVTGRRKDGSTFPLDLAVSEFSLARRRMFIGLVRDLTRRRQLETQLRQAQKMEAIGRLAGGIAHDFNNILTVILGQTEFLLNHLAAADLRTEVEQISEAAQQAASLTHQLLAFSRQQPLNAQTLNLNEVIGDMEKMLTRLIGERINLVTRLSPAPAWIKIDPGQIQQVIMNLVINARDAMPQGGQLTLETDLADLAGSDLFQSLGLAPGPYVLLTITDTGIGMDVETQMHIFEPFFTTKDIGRGTGLGLSTTYAIIQQNRGYISVESQLGHGSTFKVYLPQLPMKMEPAQANLSVLLPSGNETILLIEDEVNVRLVTRKYLQKQGYTVLEANCAQEALQICRQQNPQVNLVITDVILPDMSGPELGERLRQSYPLLKILYISGYANDIQQQQGSLDHNPLFLQKPFSSEILARKVREALDTPGPQSTP